MFVTLRALFIRDSKSKGKKILVSYNIDVFVKSVDRYILRPSPVLIAINCRNWKKGNKHFDWKRTHNYQTSKKKFYLVRRTQQPTQTLCI